MSTVSAMPTFDSLPAFDSAASRVAVSSQDTTDEVNPTFPTSRSRSRDADVRHHPYIRSPPRAYVVPPQITPTTGTPPRPNFDLKAPAATPGPAQRQSASPPSTYVTDIPIDPALRSAETASVEQGAIAAAPLQGNEAVQDQVLTNPAAVAPAAALPASLSPKSDAAPTGTQPIRVQARRPSPLRTALGELPFPGTQPPSSASLAESNSVPVTPADSVYSPGIGDQGDDSQLNSPLYPSTTGDGVVSEAGADAATNDGVVPAPKKKSHARKQPPGHIKRARNAFILFRKHITDSNLIPTTVEVKHQNISVVAAKMWREAPQDVRAKFQEMARIEKEEHARKYPGYRYQPVFRRTDIIRRRVRKDPAEDEKVDAVAEALIKGKAGDELETEIKEQIDLQAAVPSNSDGETSASRSRNRRRRDPGQLSKGAIRAQRAQQRAKQMRANLLGHNLLNMSLYNAAQQQAQQQQRAAAAAAAQIQAAQSQAQAGYAAHYAGTYGMEYGVPVGYDLDGHPIIADGYPAHPYAGLAPQPGYPTEYSDEMYRLPPMGYDDHSAPYLDHQGRSVVDYYPPVSPSGGYPPMGPSSLPYPPQAGEYLPPLSHQHPADVAHLSVAVPPLDYSYPPSSEHVAHRARSFANPQAHNQAIMGGLHAHLDEEDRAPDPRVHSWTADAQQTPSGHVNFNEHLFDGELAGPGFGGKDEGLGDFDDAIQQANEMSTW